jgi:hypothetical protein
MILGLGVLFLGYSSAYYGLSQLKGQNYGFLDLVLPGRWNKITKQTPEELPKNDDGTTPASARHEKAGGMLGDQTNRGNLLRVPSSTTPAANTTLTA